MERQALARIIAATDSYKSLEPRLENVGIWIANIVSAIEAARPLAEGQP